MDTVEGWPVVVVGAELLRRDPAALLVWVGRRSDSYSLVIDARSAGGMPELRFDANASEALARCVRVAICVGRSASLGIVWQNRLRALGNVERRLFIETTRAIDWAREPHVPARATWISFMPLRPSIL
jgi:hypothetical protein